MRYFSISFIIILPLIFGQCPKTESNKIEEKSKVTESKESFVFEEIAHKIHNRNDTCLEFEILVDKYNIIMSLNKDNGSSNLILDKRIVNTDFNFVYDTDLESALEEIKLLKSTDNNDDIILFLPVTTEEFATFQIIKYESQTKTFEKGLFTIDTHEYENVINFYLSNSIKLNLIKNKFEISIGDFYNNGEFRKLKSIKK